VSGQLPETERDAFEARLLEEQELSDTVAVLEFELLDELAAGTLAGDERSIVEAWARADETRWQRAQMSGLLAEGKGLRPRRSSWKAAGFLLMAASLAVAVVLVVWRQERLGRPAGLASAPSAAAPMGVAPAESASAGQVALDQPRALEQARPDTILLVAARLRGSEDAAQVYRIHKNTPLRVQVIVPPSSEDLVYSLRINRIGNKQFALERGGVTPTVIGGLRFVEATFPGNALEAGNYVATLGGASGTWTSRFSVSWKSDPKPDQGSAASPGAKAPKQ
jgi:hypothetical protein